MKVCVIGSGNIGTQFAVELALKGHYVTMHSSKPEKFSGKLSIFDVDTNTQRTASIGKFTSNINEAVADAEVIFVTRPAFMLSETANEISRSLSKGVKIGILPGTGGAEFAFKKALDAGAVLFGLQRVPSVARLMEYGKEVRVEGKRSKLHLAAIPHRYTAELANFVGGIFDMPCECLPNYLCVTLTPSNPILHTTRLCTLFSDWKQGVVYKRNPLFYGEWSDVSSRLLLKCDDELQQICRKITKLDLQMVRSLRLHYESETPEALTKKIRSIRSLHTLQSPMIELENGGFVPDFNSRYFTADFPYGLAIIKQFARVTATETPNIDYTLNWYESVSGCRASFCFEDYGITDVEHLYELYCRD